MGYTEEWNCNATACRVGDLARAERRVAVVVVLLVGRQNLFACHGTRYSVRSP